MNKTKQLFNSLFNKTLNNRQYYPRRWRPGRRRPWNKMSGAFYNLSENTMVMGPGSTTIRVTYDIARSGVGQDSFTNMFGINNELVNQFRLYKYFRIKLVNVVVFANNASNVPSFFMVDWDGRIYDNTRLYKQDGVKMCPGFLMRTKVFSFRPPNMTINFATGLNSTINYREWSSTDQVRNANGYGYVFPSYFIYDIPEDNSIVIRYEMIAELRGNKIYEEPTGKANNDKININIIKEAKDEEEKIPKPLFYNSGKQIPIKSKSLDLQPSLFKASNLQGNLQQNNIFG